MNFLVRIYQRGHGRLLRWTTVGLGPLNATTVGRSTVKMQQALIDELKSRVARKDAHELGALRTGQELTLAHVHLALNLKTPHARRKRTGHFPLILEPRAAGPAETLTLAYHPYRQHEWFPFRENATTSLAAQASAYFARRWAALEDAEIEALALGDGADRLRSIGFTAQPRSVLDKLKARKKSVWDDLVEKKARDDKRERTGLEVLSSLGIDETARASAGGLAVGLPRARHREELRRLLCGPRSVPVVLIGRPGVGKSTLLAQWVHDLLEADGYPMHRNFDRARHVWRISGRRIIAGMMYIGDWEQRCTDLLEEVWSHRVVLRVDDLHAFGRIARSSDNDRNLAEFFRGPVGAGELLMVGECTAEQWQRLEDDAPSFAALFTAVTIEEPRPAETLRMLLYEARALEPQHEVTFLPAAYRAVLETGGALFPATAFPGKAIDLLHDLARRAEPPPREDDTRRRPWPEVDGENVLAILGEKTGLAKALLDVREPFDVSGVEASLARRVMGQPHGLRAAVDLLARIRAGLTDPHRPYAVYLLTGPTGTGKTEMAKALAEYLYGDRAKLLRFDMSELAGPDAAARLIGDRFAPEGLLTQAVRRQPFSVVLFDEVEKAHRSVFPLFLQLFDEGRLTDAAGNAADFTRAVVLMTSNLGATSQASLGFGESTSHRTAAVQRALEDFFAPELLNRIDRVVPFEPLSRDTARAIAQKELRSLLARWGLVERNISVTCTESAFERVVAEGFDATYGARTVKRYLEDHLASRLAAEITAAGPTALRILLIYARPDGFHVHAESLREGEIVPARYTIEPLLSRSARELQGLLPKTLDELDALLADESLAALSREISERLERHNLGEAGHAGAVHDLDALRAAITRLRRRVGFQRGSNAPDKAEILEQLAELQFLRRALVLVRDPEQHAVFVKLQRLGLGQRLRDPREPNAATLLDTLTRVYAGGRAELEAVSALLPDGRTLAHDPAERGELDAVLAKEPDVVVLKLVGLCLLDYLGGEAGCHVWRSLAAGTDIVRVDVTTAPPGRTVRQEITAHREAARAFAAALEASEGTLPENPAALRPIVRDLRFDGAPGPETRPVHIEDYVLGHAETIRARSLADVLPRLLTLRMSRTEEP